MRFDFDISFANAFHTFGYIFRIVMEDETNLDMVSVVGSAHPKIDVIYNGRALLEFQGTEEVPAFAYDKWFLFREFPFSF